MKKPSIGNVAVIGAGVIGRSWILVFARAGCRVRVYDADPEQLGRALSWAAVEIKRLRAEGVLKKKTARAWRARIEPADSLEGAVAGVGYVQESGPERLDLKQALFAELDQVAPAKAILASSTSAMDMSAIAAGLGGADRCVVAHPVNPPHVVPAVEVLGGVMTRPGVVKKTIKFLRELGQVPVLMHKFVPGFLINRMQAALVREAVDLVATGVADVEAVDNSIRAGLGLRWALLGPFGVANTNADGGVRDYFTRYGDAYHQLWSTLRTDVQFTDDLVERLGRATDRALTARLSDQRVWRDRLVLGIRNLKAADPLPSPQRRKRRQD